MKACRKCRENIHDKASICPYCRSPQPDVIGDFAKLGCVGLVVALCIAGLSTCSGSKSTAPSQDDKIQWLAANGSDPKALDDRFSIQAQAACSVEADDYLRSIAQNDFAWDDDTNGMFGVRFDKFSLQSAGPGLLTLITTRAKLSNGFGAFQHIVIYCLYDVGSRKVLRFSQSDPADDVILEADNAAAPVPLDEDAPPAAVNTVVVNDAGPPIPQPKGDDDEQPASSIDPARYPADPD